MNPRSYLYVPGDAPEKLQRAGERGADAVIFDLEDAVAFTAKERARHTVAVELRKTADWHAQRWVRLNATTVADDAAAIVCPALTGVVLPKAEPDLLAELDVVLTALEHRQGIPVQSIKVVALIESARGMAAVDAVAAAVRVVRLGLGEADLIGELGLQPSADRVELTSLRLRVVLASAVASLSPPIGPVQTQLDVDAELEASTRALLRLGFRARTAIHPRQIETINRVFTPTPDEVARARELIDRLGTQGVAVCECGQMLDAAVIRSAYEVLARVR